MKSNPITQYLIRDHYPPSLIGAGLLALGICVFTMMRVTPDVDRTSESWIICVSLFMLINLLGIAFITPLLMLEFSEDQQLVKLPLSPLEIQQGLYLGALFWVRVPLAIQLGLLPAWVVKTAYLVQEHSSFLIANPPPGILGSHDALMVCIASVGISLFGSNLVAVVFGVRQMIRSEHREWSIFISLGLWLSILVLYYILVATVLGVMLLIKPVEAFQLTPSESYSVIMVTFVAFVIPPYILATILYWTPRSNPITF